MVGKNITTPTSTPYPPKRKDPYTYWRRRREKQKERRRKELLVKRTEIASRWDSLDHKEKEEKRKKMREAMSARKEHRKIQELLRAQNIGQKGQIQVVIELDFEELMNDQECRSTARQLALAYSVCRASNYIVWPSFVSLRPGGKIQKELARQCAHYENWPCTPTHQSLFELFPESNRLQYLCADSTNILDDVIIGSITWKGTDTTNNAQYRSPLTPKEVNRHQNGKTAFDPTDMINKNDAFYTTSNQNKALKNVYVIGGFVDRNRYKGETLRRAKARGISHSRLPLREYFPFKKSNVCKVLTVNHVVEVLSFRTAGLPWSEAFEKVLPHRRRTPAHDDN